MKKKSTWKFDELIFTDDYFFDQITVTQFDFIWWIKSGNDLTTKHQGQSLNTFEIGMLNSHYASIGKQLLWIVVDQLSNEIKRKIILMREWIN